MYHFQKYSREFQDLHSEVHKFDAAREVHDKLSHLLNDKRVFFDLPREEFKDESIISEGRRNGSSLNDDSYNDVGM
jgi:hypothetical protein